MEASGGHEPNRTARAFRSVRHDGAEANASHAARPALDAPRARRRDSCSGMNIP